MKNLWSIKFFIPGELTECALRRAHEGGERRLLAKRLARQRVLIPLHLAVGRGR